MKYPTKCISLNTRDHQGWNQLVPNWHAAVTTTDKVKSGELVLPCPPNKPGGSLGTKLTWALLVSWTVYVICKVKRGYIKRKKSNEAFCKEISTNSKNQRTILDTNMGELKRPTPQGDQRITASKTKVER